MDVIINIAYNVMNIWNLQHLPRNKPLNDGKKPNVSGNDFGLELSLPIITNQAIEVIFQ